MHRTVLILACLACLAVALPAAALDWSAHAPEKSATPTTPPPADPDVLRQGGDTIADAVPLSIPTIDQTGTTIGYNDDYDEVCPYTWSDSPDVVYSITPEQDTSLDIDLFGSEYDTKVFVYDQNLALIACNDDYYSDYTSFIQNMPVTGGVQYYVVMDGYGGDAGDYLLSITEFAPCEIECPAGAELEGEPPLTIDYVDEWNGGCASDVPELQLQPITSQLFCGTSGWYIFQGGNSRDTDWYLIEIPAGGALEIVGDAEFATYMFELGPQDCSSVSVLQNVAIGPCQENTMVITGAPGSQVWFWVGPTVFASPLGIDVQEYDYVLRLNVDVVATESMTFSEVKALFE